MDTSSATTPGLHRLVVEPPADVPAGAVVECPKCGHRFEPVTVGEAARAVVAVVSEPGPRNAGELRAVRVLLAARLRVMFEVMVGRRDVRQVEGVVTPSVQRYLKAARPAGATAVVLRSLRLCFPADDVVEVAAVVRSADRQTRAPATGCRCQPRSAW